MRSGGAWFASRGTSQGRDDHKNGFRHSACFRRASILLLAYHQEDTAGAALRSCLAQRGEALDIVASDDASTDDTYRVLAEEAARYRGPHRVTVRRNDATLGIAGHYNDLLARTSSELPQAAV